MSKLRRPTLLFLAAVLIAGLMASSRATEAASKTWDGDSGDGLWSTALNWSGDTVPQSTDVVLISGDAGVVRLDVDFTVEGGIEIGSFSLADVDTLVVDPGVTLTIDAPGQTSNLVNRSGQLINNGVIQNNRQFRAQLGGAITNNPGATFNNTSTLFVSGLPADVMVTNNVGATFTGTAGTIEIGRISFPVGNSLNNAGSFIYSGAIKLAATLTNSATLDNSGGSLQILCQGGNVGTFINTGTFIPGSLSEQCKVWDNDSGDGLWSNPVNWSLDTKPSGSGTVRIHGEGGADTTVTMDEDYTQVFGTIEIGQQFSPVVKSTLIIAPGVSTTIGQFANIFMRSSTLTNRGTLTNNRNLLMDGRPDAFGPAIFNNEGLLVNNLTFNLDQQSVLENDGQVDNQGTTRNDGTINNYCGALITGPGTVSGRNAVVEFLCVPDVIAPPDGSTTQDDKPDLVWENDEELRAVTMAPRLVGPTNPTVPIELVALSLVSAEPLGPLSDGDYEWRVTSELASEYSPGYPFVSSPIDSSVFSFTVEAGNNAPVAQDASDSTDEDVPLNGALSATDLDDDPLSFSLVSAMPASQGSVTVQVNGDFLYMPAPNFNGQTSFTFKANDGTEDSNVATVTITVVAVNDAPTAQANGPYEVDEGSTITLDGSGSDIENDPLSFAWDLDNDGQFDDSTLEDPPFTGLDGPAAVTVRLQVCDTSQACGVDTATVTVNNVAPTADAGADQTVFKNELVNLSGTWTDPAGSLDDPYSWEWDLDGDTAADVWGTALFPGPVGQTTVFALEGTYDLTFTIEDKDGDSDEDTVRITVVNRPLDCSNAGPSVETIWPPNHKMVAVSILGVTDGDGEAITISIDSIFQDEPLNTTSDGNTEIDGDGVGSDAALVRAERAGSKKVPGNGRVYYITYTADDGHGGQCSDTVEVGVPHDQGKQKVPVGDGPLFDSTGP